MHTRADGVEADPTAGVITSLLTSALHPVEAAVRFLGVDFDFDGCVLCDDESLHADLVALFERCGGARAS